MKSDQQIIDSIGAAIAHTIRKEVELIIEEESKAAVKRTEERVRAKTGEIAALVLNKYSFESIGNELRIIVDFRNTEQGKS